MSQQIYAYQLIKEMKPKMVISNGAARIKGNIYKDAYNIVNAYSSPLAIIVRKIPKLSDGTTHLSLNINLPNTTYSVLIDAKGLKENSTLVIPANVNNIGILFSPYLDRTYIEETYILDIIFSNTIIPIIYTYDSFNMHYDLGGYLSEIRLLKESPDISVSLLAGREIIKSSSYHLLPGCSATYSTVIVYENAFTMGPFSSIPGYNVFEISGDAGEYYLDLVKMTSYKIINDNINYGSLTPIAIKIKTFGNSIIKYIVTKYLNDGDKVDILVYDNFTCPEDRNIINSFSFTANNSGTIRKSFVDYVSGSRDLYVQVYVNDTLDFSGLEVEVTKI